MADKTTLKKYLLESSEELGVSLVPSGIPMTLVDFCESKLSMTPAEIVEFCSEELIENVPVVMVTEATIGDYGDRLETGVKNIWSKIRGGGQKSQSKEGTHNVFQQVGDALNTKGSVLRNAPMLQIINPKTQVAKYYAFPALALTRPGHKEVFDRISQKEQSEGNIVNQIPINHEARVAALKAGNYSVIQMPPADANKREAIQASLQKLQTIIQQAGNFVAANSFVSDQEAANLSQTIQQAMGGVTNAIKSATAGDEAAAFAQQLDATQAKEPAEPIPTGTGTNIPAPTTTLQQPPAPKQKPSISGSVASPTQQPTNSPSNQTFTYNPIANSIVGDSSKANSPDEIYGVGV